MMRSSSIRTNPPSRSRRSHNNRLEYLTDGCHRIYSCIHCRAHLANHDELVSTAFHGTQGRAYLFNSVVNVRCGPSEQRLLMTGLHDVADIYCDNCKTTLGWKYKQAFEASQKYKEGKYILELAHLLKENNWDLTSYNTKEIFKEVTNQQHVLRDWRQRSNYNPWLAAQSSDQMLVTSIATNKDKALNNESSSNIQINSDEDSTSSIASSSKIKCADNSDHHQDIEIFTSEKAQIYDKTDSCDTSLLPSISDLLGMNHNNYLDEKNTTLHRPNIYDGHKFINQDEQKHHQSTRAINDSAKTASTILVKQQNAKDIHKGIRCVDAKIRNGLAQLHLSPSTSSTSASSLSPTNSCSSEDSNISSIPSACTSSSTSFKQSPFRLSEMQSTNQNRQAT